MFSPFPVVMRAALAACAAWSISVSPASAFPLSWDPSAVGLNGSAFPATVLYGSETSRITPDGVGGWKERGFIRVVGEKGGPGLSNPTGVDPNYTMYFDFSISGDSITNRMLGGTMTLYGVNGASRFGFDSENNPTVSHGADTPIVLASAEIRQGNVGMIPIPIEGYWGYALFADVIASFYPHPDAAQFFGGSYSLLSSHRSPLMHGSFYHAPDKLTFLPDGGILLTGDSSLRFVPEPATLALVLAGALGLRRLASPRALGRGPRSRPTEPRALLPAA